MKTCPTCRADKPESEFYVRRRPAGLRLHTYCKACCVVSAKGRYATDPEGHREKHREWVLKNPDRVAMHKAKSSFGLSTEEYDALVRVCVICGSVDNLCIDHCHKKGHVRGMLCNPCNKGLGFFRDNPALLNRAADYILGHAKPNIFAATYEPVEA